MRRIGEMCEDKWWETNKINHPSREGNDCFWFDAIDLLTGRKVLFAEVPGDRPFIYLWTKEEAETRMGNKW